MGKIECGLEQAAQGGTEDACVPTPGVCTAKGFAVLCLFAQTQADGQSADLLLFNASF